MFVNITAITGNFSWWIVEQPRDENQDKYALRVRVGECLDGWNFEKISILREKKEKKKGGVNSHQSARC